MRATSSALWIIGVVVIGCGDVPPPAPEVATVAVESAVPTPMAPSPPRLPPPPVEAPASPPAPVAWPTSPPTASLPEGRCPISMAKDSPRSKPTASPAAGDVDAGSPSPKVANAGEVVAKAASAFRRCYNRGLREDPDTKGSTRVTARVDAAGCVSAASSKSVGLSSKLETCVEDRVRQMEFAPPAGGSATIVIPVTFVVDTPAASSAPATKP